MVKEVLTPEQAEIWYFVLPDDGEQEVTLVCGEDAEGVDFINARWLSISGQKWEDYTCDGEGDEPVDGVKIVLENEDGEEIASDITEDGGKYSFEDLVPGTYTVREELSAEQLLEWYPKNPDTGAYENIELVCGQPIEGLDFVNSRYLSISGTKWEDPNANGSLDGDENGVEGVTIVCVDEDGVEHSDVTDENGDYSITGLKPGTYEVSEKLSEELLAEWYIVYPVNGTYTGIVLACDEPVIDLDFFNNRKRSITGYKYIDSDGSGTWDPAEDEKWDGSDVPITITLYQNGLPAGTYVIDSAGGMFEFTGLIPGDYTLEETFPEGENVVAVLGTSIDVTVRPEQDLLIEGAFLNTIVEAAPIIIVPPDEPQVGPQQLPATGWNQLSLMLAAGLFILLGMMALMLGVFHLRRS
jgi:hypothetical protein